MEVHQVGEFQPLLPVDPMTNATNAVVPSPGYGVDGEIRPVGTDRTDSVSSQQPLGEMMGSQIASTAPPNACYLTRFSRNSSTTGSITASRQERQIVQSWLNLDDFLPRFHAL